MNMSLLAEGTWPCTVLSAEAGEVDGIIKARVNVKIEDGPSKGRTCTYEDNVDARSSIYVARSLTAVGWKGKTLASVKDDCATWITATGGKSTVEIKHIEIKKGKRAGQIWDKPNSIGRGPKPLAAAGGEALSDADAAMRKALAEDGVGGGGNDEQPQRDPDDIPFITSSWLRVNGGVL
jgi:hypothetical protein